jgi:glycosyltransferase involved in cell wall biosynthesis
VIPTYDRSDVVARTLRHLRAQTYPTSLYEVIVVDNSRDDTPAVVRRIAATAGCRVRLIADAPKLPAVKRNLGVVAATGELVLFLNDDVWARSDLLSEHARSHAASGTPIAVVGHVEQSKEMPDTPFTRAYRPFAFHEIADRADATVPWRYFWSMNLSIPRSEMLGRHLLFHEEWTEIGHEDVELGYRWARAGRAIVYNPRAWVEHFHPHSVVSACRLQDSIGRGLRELEQLVPEPGLLERYGVFSWGNSPRAITRGLVRRALFNKFTSPLAARWLDTRKDDSPLARWMYWKVLLHYTNSGYHRAAPRVVRPRATLPPLERAAGR